MTSPVTYVFIANSARTGADWLPFFSKINLMQRGRRVRVEFGAEVSIVGVPAKDCDGPDYSQEPLVTGLAT
jgi:hypothetical protein